ncbi:hypothetical protein A0H81_01648 [Grifola frondosa]|uniref:Uncharacterized protein n=1 Tax=Grifola frondosa TaxID=5627 RepID=A0A1C7MKA2_GRIFR|nr:hypothetical protein A0H81_01648 [Grifola frondosa]
MRLPPGPRERGLPSVRPRVAWASLVMNFPVSKSPYRSNPPNARQTRSLWHAVSLLGRARSIWRILRP